MAGLNLDKITREELTALLADAVSMAMSERRKEDFQQQSHHCLLSEEEKQAIKDLAEIFRRVKDVKWKVAAYIVLSLLAIFGLSVSVSVKSFVRGCLQ